MKAPTLNPSPWEPLERLLWDHAEGLREACAEVVMEDGGRHDLPAEIFFQSEEELSDADLLALEMCCGSILDVGAGAGRHALVLQERESVVDTVEIRPRLAELQERRGVRRAHVGDVLDPLWAQGRSWDTLLMLMNGIGLVGDLEGLDEFLRRAHLLVSLGGRILLDSCDLSRVDDPSEAIRVLERTRRGRYYGETRQRIEYQDLRGETLEWLYVDPAKLAVHAQEAGWSSQVLFDGGDGSYLACLQRIAEIARA